MTRKRTAAGSRQRRLKLPEQKRLPDERNITMIVECGSCQSKIRSDNENCPICGELMNLDHAIGQRFRAGV